MCIKSLIVSCVRKEMKEIRYFRLEKCIVKRERKSEEAFSVHPNEMGPRKKGSRMHYVHIRLSLLSQTVVK